MSHLHIKTKEIYGNCGVMSPDGILMFKCDYKKANWYLKRDLADVVDNDPLVIKLKFQPKGLGFHNQDFGLNEMANACVVCGTTEDLTKHHVVPYLYRKHLPLEIKSHNFHDVLAVCVDCHGTYERRADIIKQNYADEYNIPISGIRKSDKDLIRCAKLSSTLLNNNKIPLHRVKELKFIIKEHFNIKRLTKQRLKIISKMDIDAVEIKNHGEVVVSDIDNIQDFISMWRQHFVDEMKPGFLPKNWSI